MNLANSWRKWAQPLIGQISHRKKDNCINCYALILDQNVASNLSESTDPCYDSEKRCLYARTSVRKMKLATGGKFCVRLNDRTIVRQLKEYLFWDFLTNLFQIYKHTTEKIVMTIMHRRLRLKLVLRGRSNSCAQIFQGCSKVRMCEPQSSLVGPVKVGKITGFNSVT